MKRGKKEEGGWEGGGVVSTRGRWSHELGARGKDKGLCRQGWGGGGGRGREQGRGDNLTVHLSNPYTLDKVPCKTASMQSLEAELPICSHHSQAQTGFANKSGFSGRPLPLLDALQPCKPLLHLIGARMDGLLPAATLRAELPCQVARASSIVAGLALVLGMVPLCSYVRVRCLQGVAPASIPPNTKWATCLICKRPAQHRKDSRVCLASCDHMAVQTSCAPVRLDNWCRARRSACCFTDVLCQESAPALHCEGDPAVPKGLSLQGLCTLQR